MKFRKRVDNWFYDNKQKLKLRKYKTEKYLYELYAYVKNSNKYKELKYNFKAYCSDALLLMVVVFGIKNGNSLLLGISIAIIIDLSQRYIDWFLQIRKKYR